MAAAAFDLELGDDLLDPRERDRVLKFIKEFKARTRRDFTTMHSVQHHAEYECH